MTSADRFAARGVARVEQGWRERLWRDRQRADALLTGSQRLASDEVCRRAIAAGARAVALTGSTVRRRRTSRSDLDFMVVGRRPDLSGIGEELDVYAVADERLFDRLRAGDDYIRWTLRFGCVLQDDGVLALAAREVDRSGRWPSPQRKLEQARRSLRTAGLVLESGDWEAALEQCCAALTTTARWVLLRSRVFPLSRAELPAQLAAIGERELAGALREAIGAEPSLDQLSAFLRAANALLPVLDPARRGGGAPGEARRLRPTR